MISHINIGTNNLERAEAFFDELLKPVNGKQLFKADRVVFYVFGDHGTKLAVNTPFDGKPATHGNGSMVAFSATSKEQVDAVYAKALELGATCEGKPGDRFNGAVYAAYFRDLDGNKFGVLYGLKKVFG